MPDIITRTIIPAQPGWYIVRFMCGGEDSGEVWNDYLASYEIIAWSIEMHAHHVPRDRDYSGNCSYECIPLTVDGAADNVRNPWAVKSPQGKYTIINLMNLDTEEETLKELKEQWVEQKRGTR